MPESEARIRFAQYGILRAISLSRELSRLLVFKGGNALDFIWQPNRSTSDLDFSIDMAQDASNIDVETLRALFDGALTAAFRDANLISRTRQDYDSLRATARTFFIPFSDALEQLHTFVETLSIPAK